MRLMMLRRAYDADVGRTPVQTRLDRLGRVPRRVTGCGWGDADSGDGRGYVERQVFTIPFARPSTSYLYLVQEVLG